MTTPSTEFMIAVFPRLTGDAQQAAVTQILADPNGASELARHPDTPTWALEHLARAGDLRIRKHVAGRVGLPAEVRTILLNDRAESVRVRVGGTPAARPAPENTGTILERVAAGDERVVALLPGEAFTDLEDDVQTAVLNAVITKTPGGYITPSSAFRDAAIARYGVAALASATIDQAPTFTDAVNAVGAYATYFDPDQIAAIATAAQVRLAALYAAEQTPGAEDLDQQMWTYRTLVAAMPTTDPDTLGDLVTDSDGEVSAQAALNPNSPLEVVSAAYLAGDISDYVMRGRLAQPGELDRGIEARLPAAVAIALTDDIVRERLTPDVYEFAARHSAVPLRTAAACATSTPVHLLDELTRDDDLYVQYSAFSNPSTPTESIIGARTPNAPWVAFNRLSTAQLLHVYWPYARDAISTDNPAGHIRSRLATTVINELNKLEAEHPGALTVVGSLSDTFTGTVAELLTVARHV